MAAVDAQWPDDDYLAEHFNTHRKDTVTNSVDEYDQSARYAIAHGRRFNYWQEDARQTRVGYYDEETELFTALDRNEQTIITHFRPDDPDYPYRLPQSTY